MEEVRSAPGGVELPIRLNDPRWPASDGWVKMQQVVNGVNIHYVRNTHTGGWAMILTCIENDPRRLSPGQVRVPAKYQSKYALTVGVRYAVVGMMLYGNFLYLLVEDDNGGPFMAPAPLFAGEPVEISHAWLFRVRGRAGRSGYLAKGDETIAVWGYPELVSDDTHYMSLTEWEPGAMRVFRRHLEEVKGAEID